MKHLPIIICLILLTSCAHHKDRKPWDTWDMVLAGGLVGATAADIASSDYNTSNGHDEQNPICGDGKPSTTIPVNIAVLAGAYFVADYLPPKPRKWFLGISNVVRWTVVGVNINAD